MATRKIDEAYAITDDGRVWSYKTNKWLSQANTSNGYKSVRLHGKSHSVHRLVAQAFCDNPEDKCYVNHLDGDKHNNHVDNLEWVTASENAKHAYANGLQVNSEKQREAAAKQAYAMGMQNRKLTMQQAREIRQRHSAGEKLKPLSDEYGVSVFVASNIARNVSYKEAV